MMNDIVCVELSPSPSLFKNTYMIKMRQEAQNRKRRMMHTLRPPVGGADGGRANRRNEAPENVFARLARGEMDEEEYLTDDEQLDVIPGLTHVLSVLSHHNAGFNCSPSVISVVTIRVLTVHQVSRPLCVKYEIAVALLSMTIVIEGRIVRSDQVTQ